MLGIKGIFHEFRSFPHRKKAKISLLAFGFAPMTTTTTSTTSSIGNTIFTSIWNLFMGFISGILSGIEGLLNDVFGGIGGAISSVFSQWGFSVSSSFGVWAPVGMVVILATAGAVVYLFIDAFGVEKDVASDEEEI